MNGYFHDSKGNKSSTRLIVFMAAVVGLFLYAWLILIKNDVSNANASLAAIGAFIIIFKGMGKMQENMEKP